MTYPRFETETYGNSEMAAHHPWSQKSLVTRRQAECRGTQREYSSKPLKDSIVERLLVCKW